MATEDSVQAVFQTPQKVVPKGTLYDVSVLKAKPDQDVNRLESILLAWALILYRQNHGNHVQFCWGLSEVGTTSVQTYEFDTSRLPLIADDSLATALGHIRTYLQNNLPLESPIEVDHYKFFFNDEYVAAGNASSSIAEDGDISITWGNVQLQAVITDEGLWLMPSWRQPLGAEFLAGHFTESLIEMLRVNMSNLDATVKSSIPIGEVDKSAIWNWNKDLPPTTNICIHDLIAEQVREQPNSPAICGWDGDLTYAEVDQYSTTFAWHLIKLGLQIGNIVPLCFEKSRWTTIAVLAVIKAGGAFVLMDPSQPMQRRQIMAKQVDAKFILTSGNQSRYGPEIAPEVHQVVVDETVLASLQDSSPATQQDLPVVPPESLLYIIFTSGSTGTPKGVMISHSVYSTSALARSGLIGYSKISRSLDFTSYAFDVSVDSILSTLLQGGCLCIPSDLDRVNDLSGAIRSLRVNMVNITPSVARILDTDIIPSLNSLGIGGESCSAGDIAIWGQHTRIVIGYGPAECTIGCTVNPSAAGKPYVSVGAGTGATIWLVDPDDHNKLVPIGAVGELLIEGPIVGEGYLGDPEKTAAAFIHDPTFLLEGGGGIPGRKGRLYKTGDLVRYDPDGEVGFVFVGRKDTQIKLRGQRVELGEIEHHIKKHLPPASDVVVEIIAPRKQGKESMLVAFISDREAAKNVDGNAGQIDFAGPLQDAVNSLDEKLSKALPVYMVPAAYICLSKIPMLVSGKTDRKTLRAMEVVTISQNPAHEKTEIRKPKTEAERFLHSSWCSLLGLEPNQVGTNHSFFMLGGESVLAMKLVPALRELGYILSVADVFNYPILSDMANAIQKRDDVQVDMNISPFSLLKTGMKPDVLRIEAAEQCGCGADSIEDIYPCAPMQEIHMAFYTRSKENYIAQRVADIHYDSPLANIKAAWNTVVQECSILRTRIVEFKQHGFMQVRINEPAQWREISSSLEEFLSEDAKEPMSPGRPLSRFAIVHDEALNKRYLVWTAHHAIYDGWSTELIVEHAKAAYHGQGVSRPAEFRHFIQYLADPSRKAASEYYWRAQLEGATGPQFPSLPSRSYIPDPNSLSERSIRLKPSRMNFTIATIIRAAWALLASQYSLSDDVVFGETFTGRTIPIMGIEQIEGPILATVPVRIRIDRTTSIHDFLRSIQEQSMVRAAHEHLGIQHIRRLSDDAQIACEFTMGLVIQPQDPDESVAKDTELPSFRSGNAALEALHFNSYPLMLACSLQQNGFRLLASFDSNLVTETQIQRLLSQFEYAVDQLQGDQSRLLGDLTLMPQDELLQVWEMNREPPVSPHHISRYLSSGDKYPTIRYNSWVVNTANSALLMPIGATGELLLESAVVESTEDVADTPSWLQKGVEGIPGRQGKISYTGDIVKYADDMALVFIGRKNAMTNIDGHILDLNATNTTLKRLLPESMSVASQLITPRGSSSQTPLVVAFIQEELNEGSQMVELCIDNSGVFPLPNAISVEMATAIVGLSKTLTETLPPYAIPSVYIPVPQATEQGESVDVTSLTGISEQVTVGLVTDLRKSFNAMRQNLSQLVSLTNKERVLRSSWAKFLNIEEDKLSLDDNFFRLGGDSIVAMRMVSALRQVGYRLSVASIFQHMQLRGMADALEEISTDTAEPVKEYSAFSLLNVENVDSLLSSVQDVLADSSWTIEDVLPVTEPQQRDVESSIFVPRSSVQYDMLYLDDSIDATRLVNAFQDLVSSHPILRTVFIQHNNQTLQVVLKDMNVPVTHQNIEGSLDTACEELAKTDIEVESEFAFGSPFLRLFILQGDHGKALMIRISHAQYDGVSLPELLSQFEKRYRGLEIPNCAPFSTYINYLQQTKAESVKFWRNLLQGSSPTTIIPAAAAGSKASFITKPVDIAGCSPETTLPMLVTAGWAAVMSRYLNTLDVTFASIVSGRDVNILGVDTTMGPCYQYIPIRVKIDPSWTAQELLEYTRKYFLEGSEKATLGFKEISQECADWPAETEFYGSFLNHLNREYFDALPFAETTCKVDYIIPHPEPSTPPRIVSFIEANKTYVGIEADEERREFWEARVEELATIVEEFVKDPTTVVCN